ELCRDRLPRPVSAGGGGGAELDAVAPDPAAGVGAAVGVEFLFWRPPLSSRAVAAHGWVVAPGVGEGAVRRAGRGVARLPAALLGLVFLGFAYDVVTVGASPSGAAAGLIPDFGGSGRLLLVAGIIGATVMPHVVYLHSALTKSRVSCANDAERRQLLRFQRA